MKRGERFWWICICVVGVVLVKVHVHEYGEYLGLGMVG